MSGYVRLPLYINPNSSFIGISVKKFEKTGSESKIGEVTRFNTSDRTRKPWEVKWVDGTEEKLKAEDLTFEPNQMENLIKELTKGIGKPHFQ